MKSRPHLRSKQSRFVAIRWSIPLAILAMGLMFASAAFAQTGNETTQPEGDSNVLASNVDLAEEGTAKPKKKSVIPTNPTEVVLAINWTFRIPFFIASLIAVWFITERLVVLRQARVLPKPFITRFLKHLHDGNLDPEEALELCEENGSPLAQVFAHGIRKWGKPSVEVEQAIIDGGERQISHLRKHLRVINGVATVSPLIGLLGTVWGMIEAFNGIAVADAMGSAEKLAAGIALALLTTAVGLIIAIPCLIMYMFLSGRVDRLVMEMDDLAQQVVHCISAEGLQGTQPRLSKTPKVDDKPPTKKEAG